MEQETDPDFGWVAELAGCGETRARASVEEGQAERELFDHVSAEHRREGRRSYVEIDAPLELYALVRLKRPRHVLEVGVSSGVSSAFLLQALFRNGRGTLHSVDLPSFPSRTRKGASSNHRSWTLPPGRGSGWAVPFPLRARWDLRLGDKGLVLPLLAEELPTIELFVYDVPHEDRDATQEFAGLDHRLPRGGIAIADHGPTGRQCLGLRRWAAARSSVAVRRKGLGLYGFRAGPRH